MKNVKLMQWVFVATFFVLSLAIIVDVVAQFFFAPTEIGKLASAIRMFTGAYVVVKLGPWADSDDDAGGAS